MIFKFGKPNDIVPKVLVTETPSISNCNGNFVLLGAKDELISKGMKVKSSLLLLLLLLLYFSVLFFFGTHCYPPNNNLLIIVSNSLEDISNILLAP